MHACTHTLSLSLSLIIIYPLTATVRWGTTNDFTTRFLNFSLFSTALLDLANSMPVHSLMLSSHLFLCLPCLLPSFTVPCKIVFGRPYEWGHNHTTAVCISLQWSGDLCVVQSPAGSWHGLLCWYHCLCMRCLVFCGSTSFLWLVFFF